MDKIAEFMGWTKRPISGHPDEYYWSPAWGGVVDPLKDWNDWMAVEKRIREQELWKLYIGALLGVLDSPDLWRITKRSCFMLMSATLPQRAEALMKVLEERE